MRTLFVGKGMSSLEVCFEDKQLKIRVKTCVKGQSEGDNQWSNTYEASEWVELTAVSAEALEGALNVINQYVHDDERSW